MSPPEMIGLAAASLSVLGAAVWLVRRIVRAWQAMASRMGALEDALRVTPRAKLLTAAFVVTREAPGMLWIEAGTEVLVERVDERVATVRLREMPVRGTLPVDVLGPVGEAA